MAYTTQTARDLLAKKKTSDIFFDTSKIFNHTLTCIWNIENYPIAKALANNPILYEYFQSFDSDIEYSYSRPNEIHADDKKVALPIDIQNEIKNVKNLLDKSKGYIGKHGEHIIDLKSYKIGTHYDVNLLIGNRIGYDNPMLTTPKASLDSFGRGSFRAGEARQVTATRYNLHIEENGEPCSRQIYITENGKLIFTSLDVSNLKKAECRHYQNYTEIEYETYCGLNIKRTIFILPYENNMPDAVESQILSIENKSGKQRKLHVVFTGMFGLASPESQMNDIIYASVTWQGGLIKDSKGCDIALSPKPHPKYLRVHKRFATCVCNGEFFDEYSTTYEDFVGSGTLLNPEKVSSLGNTLTMKVAPFFALGKNIVLDINENKNIISYTGYMYVRGGDDGIFNDSLHHFIEKYKYEKSCLDTFSSVKDFMKLYSSFLQVKTKVDDFNKYINYNLPFQVYYQSYVSRSFAWTQKAFREIGFREIQDMYASMNYIIGMGRADLAKSMLSQWIKNVYHFGYANHNFYQTGKQGGESSDDALWLIQAVYRYISLTNDIGFLNEEFDEADTTEKRKLIDTLNAIIVYSSEISIGKHSLPILDRADWNDCLQIDKDWIDGKTKEKLYFEQIKDKKSDKTQKFVNNYSESVMNAFLLKIAIDELSTLYSFIGNNEKEKELKKKSQKLANQIQKYAWKDDYFARVLINNNPNYTYLGAHDDGLSADKKINGTYFLNSFSWSILSGVATEEQIKIMAKQTRKYLLTKAGIKLCSPIDLSKLSSGAASDSYFPGDRENGGVFKHAEMMAACAFIKASKTVNDEKLSSELVSLAQITLDSVLPYKTLLHPFVTKGNPRFCTQYNNSMTGENIGPMLSGTASWLSLTILELLGFECNGDYITFSPVVLDSLSEYSYTITLNGTKYQVEVKKHKNSKDIGATIDGQIFDGTIAKMHDNKTHKIKFVY